MDVAVGPDPPSTLTVVKQVVNDDGGTGAASDWDVHVTQGGVDVAGSPQPGDGNGTSYTLDAGSYTVSESGGPAGYAGSISGDCAADGTVTLAPGESKTCTITNDDVAPRLTVVKHVINDDSGTAAAGDWSMHIQTGMPLADVPGSPFPGSETGTATTLDAGSYVVSESDGPKGYTATISGDCAADGTITLAPGDNKTCTITNDDQEPPATATLHVVKHVVNDDGGTAVAGDWSMHVRSGAPPSDVPGSPFPGSETGTSMTLQAEIYDVSESGGPPGYAATFSGDCTASGRVTLQPGDDKTCTVTNDDVAPTLTVIKHVVNDDGGTAAADDWSMHIRSGSPPADVAGSPFQGAEAGTTRTLAAGSYTVSESGGPAGYTASISGDCASDGTITLAPGESKTCTVTNDDDDEPPAPATLRVVKHVVNDDGGTAAAGDWSMHIRSGSPPTDVAGSPFPGSEAGTSRTLAAGPYTVSESDGPGGYTASISGDCDAAGTVTLQPGDSKTCTITNDDVANPPPPSPSTADLELSKSASDTTPVLGDEFTYSLTVFNRGPDPAAAVELTDELPPGMRLTSTPPGCGAGIVQVVCGLGGLAAGASATVSLNVEVRLGCDFLGTSGDDRDGAIGSTAKRDLICGGGGSDSFSGAGGRDRLYGLAPPEMVPSSVANTATVRSATTDPDSAANTARLSVRVVGGKDRGDTILGEGGADQIFGAAGNDHLVGGDGGDRLRGGKGKDLLEGGAKRDRLLAVDGAKDTVRCGAGRDRVRADRRDVVADDCERVARQGG